MTEREKLKDGVFLRVAIELGKLGTCPRKAVGAVIVRDGRCISWGFNGAPPGLPHCENNVHGWLPLDDFHASMLADELEVNVTNYHRLATLASERWGCRNATHAEANALAYAAKQGISTDGGTLYVETSPCLNCARLIIAAGIVRVVWATTYRDLSGSELLEDANIKKDVLLPDEYLG